MKVGFVLIAMYGCACVGKVLYLAQRNIYKCPTLEEEEMCNAKLLKEGNSSTITIIRLMTNDLSIATTSAYQAISLITLIILIVSYYRSDKNIRMSQDVRN